MSRDRERDRDTEKSRVDKVVTRVVEIYATPAQQCACVSDVCCFQFSHTLITWICYGSTLLENKQTRHKRTKSWHRGTKCKKIIAQFHLFHSPAAKMVASNQSIIIQVHGRHDWRMSETNEWTWTLGTWYTRPSKPIEKLNQSRRKRLSEEKNVYFNCPQTPARTTSSATHCVVVFIMRAVNQIGRIGIPSHHVFFIFQMEYIYIINLYLCWSTTAQVIRVMHSATTQQKKSSRK